MKKLLLISAATLMVSNFNFRRTLKSELGNPHHPLSTQGAVKSKVGNHTFFCHKLLLYELPRQLHVFFPASIQFWWAISKE